LSNFIAKQWRVATRAFSAQTLNVWQGDQIGRIFAQWAVVLFWTVSWKLHM
jgi:hypothetical protein